MDASPPIYGGLTGYGPSVLQLLDATTRQVKEVATFQAQPRDFSAPRMQLASSLPPLPLSPLGRNLDVTA